ncbi:MAG: hypothetical protein LBE38_07820 [Deltaproteobacteria bacterium]|jgi:flagellar basal body-associated protein FliL|nr:hypothetical protein [Deltaproteobacteria bacterium]
MADNPSKNKPIDDWDSLPLEPDSSWDAVPLASDRKEDKAASDEPLELPLSSIKLTDDVEPLPEEEVTSQDPIEPFAQSEEDSFTSKASPPPWPLSPTEDTNTLKDIQGKVSSSKIDDTLSSLDPLDASPPTEQKPFKEDDDLDLDGDLAREIEDTGSLSPEDSWDAVSPDSLAKDSEEKPEESKAPAPEPEPLIPTLPIEEEASPEATSQGEQSTLAKETNGTNGASSTSDIQDVDRTRFLESLLEDGEKLPRKVELDLDGIFSMAKEEAEKLSPDSTHTPQEAPPLPPVEQDDDTPAPPPEPLVEPKVRKVSKLKLLFLVLPIAVGVIGLLLGIYEIFIKKPPASEQVPLVLIDPLDSAQEPGDMTLERFYITLDDVDGKGPLVVELEIILFYSDRLDVGLIRSNLVTLRDIIYRITKSTGSKVLTDNNVRRQLQADLLTTLNQIIPFNETAGHQVLSFVQISSLRKI